jgi:hypothetical protein
MPEAPPKRKLEPLKVSCTSADCQNDLHCFRATQALRAASKQGRCRYCEADLIDWPRVHRRNTGDVDFTFASLRKEFIRHYFWHVTIDPKAANYARRKGRVRLRTAVDRRIRMSIAAAEPFRDGRQTPWVGSGNAIYYAQHAVAACCRRCVEEWHAIPRGRELSDAEVQYLADLAIRYVEERVPLTDAGEYVPPLRNMKKRSA